MAAEQWKIVVGVEASKAGRAQAWAACLGHSLHFRLYLGVNGKPLKGLKQKSYLIRFIFKKDCPARRKVWKDTCQAVNTGHLKRVRMG